MDFLTIISLFLYLVTFLTGICLERLPDNKYTNKRKRLFVLWLYLFLCFGYMTGSDWGEYELMYYKDYEMTVRGEAFFHLLYSWLGTIIPDFWVALALLKGLYLYSLLYVLKRLTPYYVGVAAFLMPISLCFLVVDNPLRFMCAQIFVNFSLYYIFLKKYSRGLILLIIAFLFHSVSFFFTLLIPVFIFGGKLYNVKTLYLLIAYACITYLASQLERITEIVTYAMAITGVLGTKDYTHYLERNEDSNAAVFTIGNMVNTALFIWIVLSKKDSKHIFKGELFYGISIIYCFLLKMLVLIPTGFRLAIPFGIIYAIYLLNLCYIKRKWFLPVIIFLTLQFGRKLYSNYTYIPYTNSIPYIVIGHDDISVRWDYNKKAYKARTGHDVDE